MKFTHLHTHSHYSLLDGLPKIDELIFAAKRNGMDALALTDHGVMYGAIEFYKKARAAGIKPIIGQEAYVAPYGYQSRTRQEDKVRRHITLLAKNYEGYKNLLLLTTKAHLEGFYYKPRIDRELLKQYAKGLIGLSGCMNGEISRLLLQNNIDQGQKLALEYQDIFGKGNFYLELQRHPRLKDQETVNRGLQEISQNTHIPMAASADSHYLKPDDQKAQETLVAINTNKDLTDENRLSMKDCDLSFSSTEHMEALFGDVPAALENTQKIKEACNLEIPLGELKLPTFPVENADDTDTFLRSLCKKGLGRRYQKITEEIKRRLNYELSVIRKTGFASYFLTIWDIVNWAKSQGIVVGPGRGSAAGSLVSYLLNITNIDPLAHRLLFERFLNPERISPPDIDIDFADTRRDEVIQYAKKRYGDDHVAQIITFGTLASRAGIRDVGRSLGHPYVFCDRLAKMIPFGMELSQCLEEISEFRKLYDVDPKAREVIDLSRKLEGVARHASTHACGLVITPEVLTAYTPLQYASQDDRTIVTQYEMHSIEDLGLLKMDFLGLKNLTIIEDTLTIVKERVNEKLDIESIPPDDKKTFELLREAHTKGVFQLESEGMQRSLKELEPSEFNDIVAMISLYRPGPMELIPAYIARKKGIQPVSYLHPKMEPALKSTYGIMIYQEQLMQIAQDLAGLSLAQADILRKAVGKKIRSLLEEQKTKLIEGMKKNGIPAGIADEVWKLIEPFDRYGFNLSHACGYALVSYQTAYLKAHYPLEFMTALLNSRQGDVERLAPFIEEARRMGIRVLPPDINESLVNFTPVGENTIRFGLKAIKNVGGAVIMLVIEERLENGPFRSIMEFLERVRMQSLNKKLLESLIKSGAFDSLNQRNTLLENLDLILRMSQEMKAYSKRQQSSLFGTALSPTLQLKKASPATLQQHLAWEKEFLGLYISGDPLEKHRALFEQKFTPLAHLDAKFSNREVLMGGSIEAVKRIITRNGTPMLFVKVKDHTRTVEVTLFPRTVEEYGNMFREGNILAIQGRVEMREGALTIICKKAKPLT
ncbi:MAG: DNA polymerase III subunit alpha [Candidatus Portnoybacteria bacterium]|nr:DNA polymerase III subunit alpha [Candidatus Portnoybacteria bacterium]